MENNTESLKYNLAQRRYCLEEIQLRDYRYVTNKHQNLMNNLSFYRSKKKQ